VLFGWFPVSPMLVIGVAPRKSNRGANAFSANNRVFQRLANMRRAGPPGSGARTPFRALTIQLLLLSR
jgi:hypothetical protein